MLLLLLLGGVLGLYFQGPALRAVFAEMTKSHGTLQERVADAAGGQSENPLVAELVRFVTADSSRAFVPIAD